MVRVTTLLFLSSLKCIVDYRIGHKPKPLVYADKIPPLSKLNIKKNPKLLFGYNITIGCYIELSSGDTSSLSFSLVRGKKNKKLSLTISYLNIYTFFQKLTCPRNITKSLRYFIRIDRLTAGCYSDLI